MRTLALCALLLLGALATHAQAQAQPAKDGVDDLENKLKLLREQIEDLRKKQADLVAQEKALTEQKREKERQAKMAAARKEEERKRKEEAERLAKAAAEKKKHVAKVEIRGMLSKTQEDSNLNFSPPTWFVTIGDMRWQLNLGDNKELAADAAKFAGKPVVIKGTVVQSKSTPLMNPYIQPPRWPNNPWPNNPWPNYPFPQPWQWQPYVVETAIVIQVTSIVEAKD